MTVTAIVGAQWGDEGKGRVVDYLAQKADMVIRFQGGDNAGHTVVNELGTFRLHLAPSGIFNPHTRCIVGTGTVVNPETLLQEISEQLAPAGVNLDNLWLSERGHVIMPYHRLLDGLEETVRGGAQIGTTRRGIGPAYADKAARHGIRLGDLIRPDYLRHRLALVLERKNRELAYFGQPPMNLDELVDQAVAWGETLGPRIIDTLPMIQAAVRGGQSILLEGQLGVMRDLDWGIYPYVTSSNPVAGAACAGAGLPPTAIDEIIGVVKAYSTAIGAGPFPVELTDENGARLREIGQEYGATTGRPRRCGWFDGVAISYATWHNGFTGLAITKLDVLDSFAELKICVGYELDGERIDRVPDTPDLERVTPMYETWPGWNTSTKEARRWDDLPKAARAYLHRISKLAGAPIQYVSVGPEREQLIVVSHQNE
ncbi:MAG: adenylosuccinate synthase [Chloroflexi bacterium HGW-Chloroflexi-1]|nr:MAG: adenylosuccinate synthase [Chloroflexi bacterium HGW-Chloroflexi-1]